MWIRRFEPDVHVAREPPFRFQRLHQVQEGRGAEGVSLDVVPEMRGLLKEAVGVPVLFDCLGPVMGEEDRRG
jgi:hypothetical protein